MANDTNDTNLPTAWAPGQPPPWLAAYGPVPPPVDDSLAGAPGVPTEPLPPPTMPPPQPGIGIPASAIDDAVNAPRIKPPVTGETSYDEQAPVSVPPKVANAERLPGDYTTKLSPSDEQAFRAWAKTNKAPFDPNDPNSDYDMRGFWLGLKNGDARATTAVNPSDGQLHYPDTWKTPYHATFSNESIYASAEAPHWENGRLVDRDGKVIADESVGENGGGSPMPTAAPGSQEPPWLQRTSTPFADAAGGVSRAATAGIESIRDGATRTVLDKSAPVSERSAAWDRLPTDRRWSLIYSTDPQHLPELVTPAWTDGEIAAASQRFQDDQQHKQALQMIDLLQRDSDAAERNRQAQQQLEKQTSDATAQVAADAMALAQEKIDPKEHGVGNFIATVLTSALGGAMSPYTGGRNPALEELEKSTQRRIDAQKANIANRWQGITFKRNLIAEQRERGADEFRAAETYRISQLERAKAELLTKAQDYIATGTTAMKISQAVHYIDGQQAAALQKYAEQYRKDRLDEMKVGLQQWKEEQDARDKKAQRDLERENSQRSAHTTLTTAKMADDRARETNALKREEMAQTKADKAQDKIDERAVAVPGGEGTLVQADGKTPWLARSKEDATKTANMLAAAADYNKLTADMIRGIREHGGESDWLKSDDWKTMKTKLKEATAALHEAYGIDSFRENTVEFIEEMATAGIDVTSFKYNATKSLQVSNADLQNKINNKMAANRYNGPRIKFEDLSTPNEAERSPFEDKTPLEVSEGLQPGVALNVLDKALYPFGGDNSIKGQQDEAEQHGSPNGLTWDQQHYVDKLVDSYQKGGKDAAASRNELLELASSTNRPSVRAGVVATLRGSDQGLWRQAVEALPQGEQEAAENLARAAHEQDELTDRALRGDQAAIDALVKRLKSTKAAAKESK